MCRTNVKMAYANNLLPFKETVLEAYRPLISWKDVISSLPAVRDMGNQTVLVKHYKIKIELCNAEVKHSL